MQPVAVGGAGGDGVAYPERHRTGAVDIQLRRFANAQLLGAPTATR